MSFFIERARKFVGRWKHISSNSADGADASPLTCRELVELTTAYFDGALAPAEVRRFDTHIDECTGCRRHLAQLRMTMQLTGTLAEEQLEANAKEKLLAAFRDWKSSS